MEPIINAGVLGPLVLAVLLPSAIGLLVKAFQWLSK